jgi:alkylhydroperoxidase/carboxymuconolactone decarboxylase family protein YurZ
MPKSGNRINSGIPTKLNTSFYDKDKFNHPGQFVQRKFKDPIHFMHNLFDLLTHTPDLIRVYFGRAISPGFREMIMLTVAITNDCNF